MTFSRAGLGARVARVVWIVVACALPVGAWPAQSGGAVVFRDVRVFDGREVRERATVVVADGRIESVGTDTSPPMGATVIDGEGRTLLPGLIDAHVHQVLNRSALEQALILGVTTELDMYSPQVSRLQAMRDEQTVAGAPERPDVYSAGVLVTAPGGHGTQFGPPIPTITDAGEAERFVDERIAEGSDYIKIVYDHYGTLENDPEPKVMWRGRYPSIDRATLVAVIDAAHARGKLAVVHVLNLESARHALDAGADGLVHLFVDAVPDEAFVNAARSRALFIVPTLWLLEGFTGEVTPAVAHDPRVRPYLLPQAEAMMRLIGTGAEEISDPAERLRVLGETVRRLAAGGVTLLAGTDAGNPGTTHGAGLHQELAALVDAGLSPSAALAAATAAPAEAFGLADRGRIVTGLRADLLLVRGDPTRDIGATRDIVGVWKLGVPVDREAFRSTHAAERAAYDALQAPGVSRLADFEGDEQWPSASVGNWAPYTDMPWGGQSTSTLAVVDGGAAGTSQSLSIEGTTVANDTLAAAGALYWPAGPVDLSSKTEIVFWAKGTDASYRILAYGRGLSRVPPAQSFVAADDWVEVTIPLSGFDGLDPHRVVSFAFVGSPEPGEFSFRIDEVRLR